MRVCPRGRRLCRERKQRELDELLTRMVALERDNVDLNRQLTSRDDEIAGLKRQVASLIDRMASQGGDAPQQAAAAAGGAWGGCW